MGGAAAAGRPLGLTLRGVYAERLRCLRQQAERYKRLAYTDPLTGAANRLAFEERLEALKSAEESVAIASPASGAHPPGRRTGAPVLRSR